MSQAESTKTLTKQDEERMKGVKRKQITDAFHKTQLYSADAATQYLQKEADSHLNEEIKQLGDMSPFASVAKLVLVGLLWRRQEDWRRKQSYSRV
jgi:hypothetical protein